MDFIACINHFFRCYHLQHFVSFRSATLLVTPSSTWLESGLYSCSIIGVISSMYSRPFGLNMLRLLLEYAQHEDCPLNYPNRSTLSEIAHDFLSDLTRGFLQYSLHNLKVNHHPHLAEAAKKMIRDGYYYHDFCDLCSSPSCPANANFCRLILICMYYLNQVIHSRFYIDLILCIQL